MSETLKACPWCLRQPQLVFGDRLPFSRDHYAVYCDNRDCKIEVAARAATEADAIAAWNARPGDAARRVHFARAIREAEAAGEARGRANSILPNDDLLERCAELLRWYSSGELTGSAIRELANAIAPTLSTHSALRLAENRTHEDAMRFVVSFIRARTDKENSND